MDVVFNKQPDGTPSSHVLVDSVRNLRCLLHGQNSSVHRLNLFSRWV